MMGATTKIAWADATFSPWWGCVEVSAECDHCYARTFSKRMGFDVWGASAGRRFFGDKHWAEPVKWNDRARKAGRRLRVFCASMADIMEQRAGVVNQRELDEQRGRLWDLIRVTPWLDWLLLTKRPQEYRKTVPADILALPQVWPGTTVGVNASAWRLDSLLELEAAGPRWVSYEPALEWVDFRHWMRRGGAWLEWVVVGGESGGKARRFDLQWARQTVATCREYGAAPFVKQMGSNAEVVEGGWDPGVAARSTSSLRVSCTFKDRNGADPSEWPVDLRVQEHPRPA